MEFRDNLGNAAGRPDASDVGSVRELGNGKVAIRMMELADDGSFGNGGSQEYTTTGGFDAVAAEFAGRGFAELSEAGECTRISVRASDVATAKEIGGGRTAVRMDRTRSTGTFNGGQGIEYVVYEGLAEVESKLAEAL